MKIQTKIFGEVEIADNKIITFDKGIIGITPDCFHVIYNYEKLVEAFITEEGSTDEKAREWLDYNTIPCLPMLGEGHPIMMFPIFDEEKKVA